MSGDKALLLSAWFLGIASCATASGTGAHDMSADQHEQAAQREAQSEDLHYGQYDPFSEEWADCDTQVVCWGTWTNPTKEHLFQAQHHRRLAQKHRRAAAALRKAEDDACEGVAEPDRDLSPFFHREDIVAVRLPSTADGPIEVVFRALPDLSRDRLQALVNCHVARSAAMGHAMPEMEYCPLVPRGVRADVRERDEGLVVVIELDDAGSREEVITRVKRLQPTSR